MRYTAVALAALCAACSAPQIPRVSIKDTSIKPDIPAAKVVTYTGVPHGIPIAANTPPAPQAESAMFHALNRAGHVQQFGNWRISGVETPTGIDWLVYDHAGHLVGTVSQLGRTEAATAAVAPGVLSYLPRR